MSDGFNSDGFNTDRTLADAANFLIQGEEYYEASILLLSNINISIYSQWNDSTELKIELIASRAIFNISWFAQILTRFQNCNTLQA